MCVGGGIRVISLKYSRTAMKLIAYSCLSFTLFQSLALAYEQRMVVKVSAPGISPEFSITYIKHKATHN